MGRALPVTLTMTEMCCGECGIAFTVPELWRAEKQKHGTGWSCPNGHWRVYGDSDVEKAKRELTEEKTRHTKTLARLNQVEAEQQRVVRRLKSGVCPCCNRTFQQLARHIKTKHPDFDK